MSRDYPHELEESFIDDVFDQCKAILDHDPLTAADMEHCIYEPLVRWANWQERIFWDKDTCALRHIQSSVVRIDKIESSESWLRDTTESYYWQADLETYYAAAKVARPENGYIWLVFICDNFDTSWKLFGVVWASDSPSVLRWYKTPQAANVEFATRGPALVNAEDESEEEYYKRYDIPCSDEDAENSKERDGESSLGDDDYYKQYDNIETQVGDGQNADGAADSRVSSNAPLPAWLIQHIHTSATSLWSIASHHGATKDQFLSTIADALQ
jgi:hypothetical protein